jgi:hypothetical protein
MTSNAFVKRPEDVLELALMGRNFSRPPSEFWGLVDRGIANDFDRLHSIRLGLFDSEVKRREAEALSSGLASGADAPPQFLELSQNN